jgi:SAM-dependent methyltransferase
MVDERKQQYFAAGTEFDAERSRLGFLQAAADLTTTRILDAIGVAEGWRCVDVGAGHGSIVRWLASRVGDRGHVVGVDIDTRYLTGLPANVEVRHQDIAKDQLDSDAYDLVHCRHVLTHLPDAERVLIAMADSLRSGGWLMAEEADNDVLAAVAGHPWADAFDDLMQRQLAFVDQSGIARRKLGSSLPGLFQALGLVDVANEGRARVLQGGQPPALFMQDTVGLLDSTLAEHEIATQSELAARREVFEDPSFFFRTSLTVAVWGRRA